MDALLAFWPGLQVLFGDLKPAVQTHEMLYQVMQMHTFLPEAFTFDFQVKLNQKNVFQSNDTYQILSKIDSLGTTPLTT